MKQCLLRRGDLYQTAWLPIPLAKRDRYVRLFEENGWRIVEVYAHVEPDVDTPHGYLSGGVWHNTKRGR